MHSCNGASCNAIVSQRTHSMLHSKSEPGEE
jgi:hypothetical protein